MVELNWDAEGPGPEDLKPGLYRVKVTACEQKASKKGDPMFIIDLLAVDFRENLCRDFIMLRGKGRSIGMGKLIGLGIEEGRAALASTDLVGQTAYAYVEQGEPYRGQAQLSVAIDADESHCGYYQSKKEIPDHIKAEARFPSEGPAHSALPPAKEEPSSSSSDTGFLDDDDTPF